MSENMPPPSWRSLVASTSRRGLSSLSSVREFLTQHDQSPSINPSSRHCDGSAPHEQWQSWKDWAGRKIRNRRNPNGDPSNERIILFPGWATRRFSRVGNQEAFRVDLFVSGYASSHRPLDNASRSQRAFIRLAKGFAALPKIVTDTIDPNLQQTQVMTPSTEDLLSSVQLPPRPSEITEDYEVQALEQQFQKAAGGHTSVDSYSQQSDQPLSQSLNFNSEVPITPTSKCSVPPQISTSSTIPPEIRKMHANLESRILPFWSSALANRSIRITVFASPHQDASHSPQSTCNDQNIDNDAMKHGPVASIIVSTVNDGSFQTRFTLDWEDLCQHPGALHIAFGDVIVEHDLLISADILPPPSPAASASSSYSNVSSTLSTKENLASLGSSSLSQFQFPRPPIASTSLRIPLTQSPIRVISDIDDTVKLAGVLSGARAVFHNVFVKELKEIIIPGMGEWYTNMWKRGVRFHYVSNGPFEMLPIIKEFFQISHLPPGSIKLKSYGGRSLFNGLLSAPATRKRAGVQEILDSFPESRFFLIGDSGEQDLELYAEFAKERPDQILGVFIRYVEETGIIDDPTGWKKIGATPTNDLTTQNTIKAPSKSRKPKSLSLTISNSSWSMSTTQNATSAVTKGTTEYFTSSPLTAEPEKIQAALNASSTPTRRGLFSSKSTSQSQYLSPSAQPSSSASSSSTRSSFTGNSASSGSSAYARMTESERKRFELQMRVYRARTQMPSHVPLRVFGTPADCVEIEDILGKEGL